MVSCLFCRSCGEVDGVRIVRDNRTGIGKGFAYVTFTESSSVLFACKQNHRLEVSGRKLRVFRCKSTTKNSPSSSVAKKSFSGIVAIPRRQWKEKQRKKETWRKKMKTDSRKINKRRKNRKS